MGIYINPPEESKESFLKKNGQSIDPNKIIYDEVVTQGNLPVCLVHNVHFTAAAVAHNYDEFTYFLKDKSRPQEWYLVPKVKLTKDIIGLEI
jgi:hypothetical protein